MSLRRKKFLPPSTKSGQVGWVSGLFLLLFLGILLSASLQLEAFRSSSRCMEDALALSNLASAVIDVEEYGISNRLVISDPEQAYERYKEAVKENLNLNESWEPQAAGMISGPVTILNFTVYNVNGNDVDISCFDHNGMMAQWREMLGYAAAPNGILIESTGVYSEITYRVDALFGGLVDARKGKLVDIVINE